MAVRIASSRCRPSARTRNRLATLAQAMSSTSPTVPKRIHRTLPMSPTASCFSGRMYGLRWISSSIFCVKPGGSGNFFSVMGIIRATSALACSRVMPGFNLARPM